MAVNNLSLLDVLYHKPYPQYMELCTRSGGCMEVLIRNYDIYCNTYIYPTKTVDDCMKVLKL